MEDIRPTAKWANRMLRPLTSIYRRLEKHQETLSIVANSKLKQRLETCEAGPSRSSTANGSEEDFSFSDGEPDDPAWIPEKPVKRRIRHKYSSRAEACKGNNRRRSRLSLRSPELQKTLPGAIEIATPLITGKTRGLLERSSARKQLFRNALSSSSTNQVGNKDGRKSARTISASYPAYKGSWKEAVDLSGDAGFVDIAHILDRIFIKFLTHTRAPNASTHGRGARSLLSMAVRCLPEFIADEQRLQDEAEEDDDVDMCDAYFTELEAHYAPHGNGWQPLREAVRAQGIYMVSEMFLQKWVSQLAACRLLSDCLSHGENDAFESMLSSLLSTINTYDYPTSFDPSRPPTHLHDPVQLLRQYYIRFPLRKCFVFDELAKLLLRKAICAEWMVTNMWKHCVDAAIKSLSTEDDESAAATRLIEAVIFSAGNVSPCLEASTNPMSSNMIRPVRSRDTRAAAMNVPGVPQDQSPCPIPIQDALSNLTLSLITALCGMHVARSQNAAAEEIVVNMRVRNIVSHLAFTVQREIEMKLSQCETDVPTYQSLRRGCVLLGDFLLQCGEHNTQPIGQPDHSGRNVEPFFLSLASRQDAVKELAAMAQQVFRCSERGHKRDQTHTSSQIRTKVSQLAELSSARGISVLLGKVAAETAMGFAETTVDPDDHVWAVDVQERVASLQRDQQSARPIARRQRHSDNRSGLYRWEDSIDEWVERTPGSKLRASKLTSRQVGGRLSMPCTIPCSTNSSTSSSAPSEDAASSVTSSPPSVSVKRTLPFRKSAPRSSKRLRLTPVEVYTDHANDSPRRPTSPASDHLTGSRYAPTAAQSRPRRGVLRELTQAKNMSPQVHANGVKPAETTSKVEVVIINHKPHDTVVGDDVQEQISRRTRSSRHCISVSQEAEPSLPQMKVGAPVSRQRTVIPCSEDSDSEDELPQGPTTTTYAAPVPRRRTVIPYSEIGDSDDELSFL